MKEWDVKERKRERNKRESLMMYSEWRDEIWKQERVYDNRQSSELMFRCRTNTLNITDRNRFKRESEACQLCGNEREGLSHVIQWCAAYEHSRKKNLALQQPYEEDEGKVRRRILFESDVTETKENMNEFWKINKRLIKLKQEHHQHSDQVQN